MPKYMTFAFKRLTLATARQVKCPTCAKRKPSSARYTRGAPGEPCVLGKFCAERKALARKVTAILRGGGFEVAERPCTGEAHDPTRGDGGADHCGMCAPRWAVVEYLRPKSVAPPLTGEG